MNKKIVLDYLCKPDQNLLVGQSVKWTGQAVKSSGKRKVWVRKSGSNQVGGVGGNVATFVVTLEKHI